MNWLRSPPRAGALIRAGRFRPERKLRDMDITIINDSRGNPWAHRDGENLFRTTGAALAATDYVNDCLQVANTDPRECAGESG